MNEQQDEHNQQQTEQAIQPHSLIDFNNPKELRSFGQKLCKLLLEQECHSLRAVEERYSLMTGVAVRYCQLLAKAQKILSLIVEPSPYYSFMSFTSFPKVSGVEREFLQEVMGDKKDLAGGQEGILLSKVNYHGREFTIRAIFGGWYGNGYAKEGALDAQRNHLTGAVHLYIEEQGVVVGKLKLQRWLGEGCRTDEQLMVGRRDLSELNSVTPTQVFDGFYISDYDKCDMLLGHFLHQLIIEVFQLTGLTRLELSADNECNLITLANGCWPYGEEDANLKEKMLALLQKGSSLLHGRSGGSSSYYLRLNELNHPRVYFNGALEPVSWSSLIAQNPIIRQPEQFAWPQFCGVALPNQLENQQFCRASVDLNAPVTCHELIKIGRAGAKEELTSNLTDIEVCQTTVCPLNSEAILNRCLLIAQFDVLFAANAKSIPEMMAMAVTFDDDGEFCRALMNRILDALVAQELTQTQDAESLDAVLVESQEKGKKSEQYGLISDLLYEFLEFEKTNADSLAVKIAKEEIEKRLQQVYPEIFK